MSNTQFRVQIDIEIINEMERLASEFGYRGAPAVGAEILTKYLPLWRDLRVREKELYEQQRKSLLDENRERFLDRNK